MKMIKQEQILSRKDMEQVAAAMLYVGQMIHMQIMMEKV